MADDVEQPQSEGQPGLIGQLTVQFYSNGTVGMNFEGGLSPTLLWGAAELLRTWAHDVHRQQQVEQARADQQQNDVRRRLTS